MHNVTNIRSFLYFVIVSGHITFEALGMCEVYKISEIASILVEAVISLGRNKASTNWVRTTFRFFFLFEVEVGQFLLVMFISYFGSMRTV